MATQNCINNSSKITTFNASGTWTKDTRTQFVTIYGWGGGSGGGSGANQSDGASSGGSGGNVYGFAWTGPALFFASSETVTIGAGGAGGASQTNPFSDGNSGSSGGTTLVGRIFGILSIKRFIDCRL